MIAIVADDAVARRVIAERRAQGLDARDEVWDGEYFMPPLAGNEHQDLATLLTYVLVDVIRMKGLGRVFQGVNISDRVEDWEQNYRIPDIAVFLNDSAAESHRSHWVGGPDFAVEIVSPSDRSREKLPFYAQVGTREVMLINRNPWQLEFYELRSDHLKPVGTASLDAGNSIASSIVPLSFQLTAGGERPEILIRHTNTKDEWLI